MNLSTRVLTVLTLVVSGATHTTADTFGRLRPFEIEFVTIGSPGNPDDTTGDPNPVGRVDYTYRISKHEISEAMIEAANADGTLGITKFARGPDRPATNVSWFEAATFVNWLNTSKGYQAAYNFDGSGNFQLWNSAQAWQRGGENLFRHKDAYYFLPNSDEWYKAAYYDPIGGVYYDYPTGSDIPPTAVPTGTFPYSAIYNQSTFFPGPADINQAGDLSPYGTMGQGGNVWEWEETESDLVNDASSFTRGLRGGSWTNSSAQLSSSFRLSSDGRAEDNLFSVGFRVASIPEPSSLLFGALAGIGLLARRRR